MTKSTTENELLQYLAECKFDESNLTVMDVSLALEYVYHPVPGFWRALTIDFVVAVLTQHLSHVGEFSAPSSSRLEQLAEGLRDVLKAHAFDEANAERLMNVPASERPKDAETASEWICNELARQKLTDDLEYARRDGDRCGEGALEVVKSLVAAQKGLVVERTGTSVARFYRAAVMNGQ
jgi:SOS response regulatory protein OraA/RecX